MLTVRVLILGGTSEASALAGALSADDRYDVVTSFAGRTASPALPPGRTRIGGFGGTDGLVRYLRDEHIDALIDATHPFAAVMPWHAHDAGAAAAVPRLRLYRPGWTAQAGDCWHRVPDLPSAPERLTELDARRVFLTTGRQELAPFARLSNIWFLLRSIDTPDVPPGMTTAVLLARPPFIVAGELELLLAHNIDTVVTKDSGAIATVAKLVAARQLGIGVVMVDRPSQPPGLVVATVSEARHWLASLT